jgi:hypothetical protein
MTAAKPPRSGATRGTRWSQVHALSRILRLLPVDCRPEAKSVLEALDPTNPTAALIYLFQSQKVEILAHAEAMRVVSTRSGDHEA